MVGWWLVITLSSITGSKSWNASWTWEQLCDVYQESEWWDEIVQDHRKCIALIVTSQNKVYLQKQTRYKCLGFRGLLCVYVQRNSTQQYQAHRNTFANSTTHKIQTSLTLLWMALPKASTREDSSCFTRHEKLQGRENEKKGRGRADARCLMYQWRNNGPRREEILRTCVRTKEA